MSPKRLAGPAIACILGAVLVVAPTSAAVTGASTGTSAGGSAAEDLSAAVRDAEPAVGPFTQLTETRLHVGDRTLRIVIADEEDERVQGLRARADIGPYDGMLFAFDGTSTTGFTMSTVPVPLAIGFYRASGRVVDRLRMEPCAGGESECPTYRSSGAFRYALETLTGDLPRGRLRA